MAPDIKSHLDKVKDAVSDYTCLVSSTQSVCSHGRVLHAPFKHSASGLFPGLHQARICLDCGLEEQSSAWTDGQFVHLEHEFVKVVTHEDIWKARFPYIASTNVRKTDGYRPSTRPA